MQRSILEDPARGFLNNDTIIIKYTIELVVSSGGALSRSSNPTKAELIKVPPPTIGKDLAELYYSGRVCIYCMYVPMLLCFITWANLWLLYQLMCTDLFHRACNWQLPHVVYVWRRPFL